MSHNVLAGRVSREATRPSEPRRFAVVLAAKPAPFSGAQIDGLESAAGAGRSSHGRPPRRFAIRPR